MTHSFKFNKVLAENGIPPDQTAILLHTPGERKLARMLPLLAEHEPAILEAFQSVHSSHATATLRGRGFMASFIRVEGGTLALAGVYQNKGCSEQPTSVLAASPAMRRVIDDFGANSDLDDSAYPTWQSFEFERLPVLSNLVGRLQIKPRLTPVYARLAEKLDADIVALSAESVFVSTAPEWRKFLVSGPELRVLPPSWSARLREWRGIYQILDRSDGARYVGAAYGHDNLLGRWQAHVASETGVTVELRRRNTRNFQFSILERVSPDMPNDDVIALERSWMERLHTIEFGLNT